MKTFRTPRLVLASAVLLAGCGHRAGDPTAIYVRELADARRAGIPVALSQLQAPRPPAAQDAAPLYTLLTERLRDRPIDVEDQVLDQVYHDHLPSAGQAAAARAALARRADLLGLVHCAAARPRCVFVRDWDVSNPNDITFPEFTAMREGARLLTTESLVLAAQGRGVAAVRNEALGFQIARHAASQPTLIASLLGTAITAVTLGGLRDILYVTRGDAHVARAAQGAIEAGFRPLDLAAAMRGEVAYQQAIVAMLRRTGPSGLDTLIGGSSPARAQASSLSRVDPAAWQRFLDANGAHLLGLTRQAITAADRPYAEASRTMLSLVQFDSHDPTQLLSVALLPDLSAMVQRRALIQAQATATRAGAAVLAYNGAHGVFPATLGQALGAVPPDPFDGRPLRYRPEGAGFVVYSGGPGGTFDGGNPEVDPPPKSALFRYPCPPYLKALY